MYENGVDLGYQACNVFGLALDKNRTIDNLIALIVTGVAGLPWKYFAIESWFARIFGCTQQFIQIRQIEPRQMTHVHSRFLHEYLSQCSPILSQILLTYHLPVRIPRHFHSRLQEYDAYNHFAL